MQHACQVGAQRRAADIVASGECKFLWPLVGTTHDCVAAADVEDGMVHVWDADGLWVGRLFDHHVGTAPDEAYKLCGENFHGSIHTNATTGEVLFFGGGQNATPVYHITGWDQFQRQHGEITIP